jgi:hypothetical protein
VEVTNNAEGPAITTMDSDGWRWSVKLANSATTERSDIYEGAGIGYTLAAAKERLFNRWMLDKNHRILRRPRNFAIAVECSELQGYAKQRSYIFVYTWPSINGRGLSVLRDVVVNAREFSVPYKSRLTVMLRTSRAIERLAYSAQRPPGS